MAAVELNLDSTELADGAPPSPLLRTRRGRFVLDGRPITLLAVGPITLSGEPISASHALVDRLSELSTASVRFQLRLETWAFCFDPQALAPWASTSGGCDLTAYDEQFWERAAELASYANDGGVLVEFVLFDAAALMAGPGRTGWWRNPFSATCGGPIPARSPAQIYQSLAAVSAVESLMSRAVQAFGALPNVTWELVSSLEGADPVRIGFVSQLVDSLRERDSLDRLVSVSAAAPKRTESELFGLQGVDAVGFDWEDGGVSEQTFADTVEMLRRFGKPVMNHRVHGNADGVGAEADERFRLTSAVETGCSSIVRPAAALPETAAWLEALVKSVANREVRVGENDQ